MTALDQALIKAFHRPSSRPDTAVAEPSAAAPCIAASPAVPLSQALAELAVTSAVPSATTATEPTVAKTATAPVGPSIAALLDEALGPEFPQAKPIEPAATKIATPVNVTPQPDVAATTEAGVTAAPSATTVTGDIDPPFAAATYVEIRGLRDTFPATTVTVQSPSSAEIGATTAVPTDAIATTSDPLTPPSAQTVTISQGPGETPWRPLLQVDRVVWPSIHSRLQATAAAAIEQMADGLLSLCASGSKVLGLASCASGEGVTTLLLAAARKLLGQGRKVVLVDANWSNPQLAQNLGLLPQIGWEETLGGGLPLDEVVIESLADGLAVLPVREPSASAITQAQIAASFDILAREFDVVLVDLGTLAQIEDEDTPSHDVAARTDAVILVQNVRITTPNQLAEVRQRLAASNLRHAGTIQNFVAG